MVAFIFWSFFTLAYSCRISCHPNCVDKPSCDLKCECLEKSYITEAFSVDFEDNKINFRNVTDEDVKWFEEKMGCSLYCLEDCNKEKKLFDCFNFCGCKSYLIPTPPEETSNNTTVESKPPEPSISAYSNIKENSIMNVDQASVDPDCRNLCNELCLGKDPKTCIPQCLEKFCGIKTIDTNKEIMTSEIGIGFGVIAIAIIAFRKLRAGRRNEIFNGYIKL